MITEVGKMEKNKVVYKESMQLQQAVEYLQAMIEDLKQGEFVIASDGNSLAFKPMDVVQLEVELEHKKGKEKLEIELSWKPEGSVEEEDEEEEEVAGTAAGEVGETDTETHERRSMSKILSLTGLAVAGGLIFGLIKGRRKKSKVRKVLEKSKEEAKRLFEQGNRLIEEGEKALEKGMKETKKKLEKGRRSKKMLVEDESMMVYPLNHHAGQGTGNDMDSFSDWRVRMTMDKDKIKGIGKKTSEKVEDAGKDLKKAGKDAKASVDKAGRKVKKSARDAK